jgi:hypothetical protein
MEVPIWAVVTLLLALVVASMIFMFSKQWLGGAGSVFDELTPEEKKGRMLIMKTITPFEIATLVELCYNESAGKKLNNDVCFSVTLDEPVTINPNEVAANLPLDANKYSIDSGTTKSFSVVWNYVKNIVEVRV